MITVTKTDAEKSAQDLLQATWTRDLAACLLPVDPFEIACALGLKATIIWLKPDVSGMLAKRAGLDPEIYINSTDSENRQRFSCAHEIGHYDQRATGDPDDTWGYIDRRSSSALEGTNSDEIYANQFATELLMPAPMIKKYRDTQLRMAAAMAVLFGVSLEAMKFRIENVEQ